MARDTVEAARRGQRKTHQAAYFAPDSKAGARMRVSLAGALQQFSADVQGNVLRGAVFAGAKVLSAELEERVPVEKGILKDAVYHFHDDKKSGAGRQVYAVGVNKVKAPHWFNVEYGHWRVNYIVPAENVANPQAGKIIRGKDGRAYIAIKKLLPSPRFVPAHPYLRPTWDAKADDAVRAMQRRLIEKLREARSAAAAAQEPDA